MSTLLPQNFRRRKHTTSMTCHIQSSHSNENTDKKKMLEKSDVSKKCFAPPPIPDESKLLLNIPR